jgi:hypothetical protein
MAIGLGVVVGLFALAGALGRASAAGISEMANPRFTTMEFAELPAWVRGRLAGLRDQFAAAGLKELTNYTRSSPRLNYSCVFASPDGLTQAVAWVARSRGITLWAAAPFVGWSAFKNDLLALPRFGLMTYFPDARLIETTPVELLAKSHVAGVMEFVIVPPGLSIGEVQERHGAAAQAFAARHGTTPLSITSAQQYLDCERAMSIRIAEKLRRETPS